jgi:hypothetical protein
MKLFGGFGVKLEFKLIAANLDGRLTPPILDKVDPRWKAAVRMYESYKQASRRLAVAEATIGEIEHAIVEMETCVRVAAAYKAASKPFDDAYAEKEGRRR